MSKQKNGFRQELAAFLADSLQAYFDDLNGEPCQKLHGMVVRATEEELFKFVLRHHAGNSSLAAKTLGISRTTLNRKVAEYGARRR